MNLAHGSPMTMSAASGTIQVSGCQRLIVLYDTATIKLYHYVKT
jgi:hypothetical protein